MDKSWIADRQQEAAAMLRQARIILTPVEEQQIEICDYSLSRYDEIGTAIVIYVNTERCCAKEIILSGGQICPEHRHPALPEHQYPGKEETFRCRWGTVYLYVPGEPTLNPSVRPPADRRAHYTVWHEVVLRPGEQYTLPPDTLHWFAAGPEGAIVSEFSTPSFDRQDIFTDPDILRLSHLD